MKHTKKKTGGKKKTEPQWPVGHYQTCNICVIRLTGEEGGGHKKKN